ncbi:hypothetical protein ACTXT7_013750 [Hymenolepis weldensis]
MPRQYFHNDFDPLPLHHLFELMPTNFSRFPLQKNIKIRLPSCWQDNTVHILPLLIRYRKRPPNMINSSLRVCWVESHNYSDPKEEGEDIYDEYQKNN